LNGEALSEFASDRSYLTLTRTRKDGDRVEVSLPMELHVEALVGDPTLQAVMYGPLVLAGRLANEGLTRSEIYLGYDPTPAGNPAPVPTINSNSKEPLGWVEPIPNRPASFRVTAGNQQISLIPFYKLFGERYVVYWRV
jgi:uncharacterized protein